MAGYSLTFMGLERRIEGWKQIELVSHVVGLLLWFSTMLLGVLQDASSLGGIMEKSFRFKQTLVLWNLFMHYIFY
jgi:hypothetical protein